MTVSLKPIRHSQGFAEIGTYEESETVSFAFGTGKTATTPITLDAYLRYPTNAPAGVALPLVIAFSGGGLEFQLAEATMESFTDFVTAGAVVVSPEYRACNSNPLTDDDGVSDTLYKRAVRAAFLRDQPAFIRYMINSARMVTANYAIDRRRIFFIGDSAGGWSAIKQAIAFGSTVCRGVAGFACGLNYVDSAMDPVSSPDTSADFRSFITENDITLSTPPIQAFLTGNDTVVGASYNTLLRSRLQALSAQHPEPQWIATSGALNGHELHATWGNWTYDGESVATLEGIRRWWNDLMSGLTAKVPSKLSFS